MNLTVITISIVVYYPNIVILRKVIESLDMASVESNNIQITLYVIDNSCDLNCHRQISECIASIVLKSTNLKLELIISSDNLGYGHGNNLILDRINSNYHIVMNPDVFVYPDTISKALSYMDKNQGVGLLSPAVYNEDGTRQYLCRLPPTLFDVILRRLPKKRLPFFFKACIDKGEMRDRDYSQPILDLKFPSGCFMFIRTALFKKLSGFDEGYFMYFEDADLGQKILRAGYSIVYEPSVKIIHQWKRASRSNLKLMLVHLKSAFRYWRKWGGIFANG